MTIRTHRAPSGFTLLEVLIAMVIVGTAVTSLMYLMSGSLSNLRRVESASTALQKAKRQMNQLLAQELPQMVFSSGDTPAVYGNEAGQWNDLGRWEASARPLRDGGSFAPGTRVVPVRVVMDVWWKRDAGTAERHFKLETIQLRRYQAPQVGL